MLFRTETGILKHLRKIFGSIEPNKKSIADPLSTPNSTRIFWVACSIRLVLMKRQDARFGLNHHVI